MELRCPSCARGWAPSGVRAIGKARCPWCQHVFAVPEPGGAEPAPPEPPAGAASVSVPPPLPGKEAPAIAPRPLPHALVIGLGLAGVLVIVLLAATCLKWLLGARSGVGAYACYVPRDASFIGCFDVAALREHGALERMGPSAEQLRERLAQRLRDLKLEEKDVVEIFFAGRPLREPIVVIGANKNVDLSALPGSADTKVKTHRGIPYKCQRTESGTCWVAQTGRRAYCLAPDEGDMLETLLRLVRRDKPALSRDLRRVLREVRQEEHYIAGSPHGAFPWARTAGVGFSFGPTVRVRVALVFPEKRAAEQFEKTVRAGLEEAIGRGRRELAEAAGDEREALRCASAILEGIEVDRRTDLILARATCGREDVLSMAQRATGGLEEMGERLMSTLMKGTPRD